VYEMCYINKLALPCLARPTQCYLLDKAGKACPKEGEAAEDTFYPEEGSVAVAHLD